jgi:EmrB/QacA subfamily drug resistance transporter
MTAENPNHAGRWAILAILGVAQLMVVLDVTIVTIALPSAQKALHFTNDNRQWIVTGYALAFGSLLLIGGRLSDLLGRKWTLIAGLSGFAIASAVGGAAQSFGMLAAARAFQGAFGALLAPSALSLLTTTFTDPSERAKAFGVFSAIAGSGASVGLLLGGVLTQSLSWRFCMYVNLAFASVAVTGALSLLHNSRPETRPRLDVPGALAVSSGLFALVFGFSHAQTTSWGNQLTIGMLGTGILLLVLFVALEERIKNPLLPLRVLADRNRGASFLSIGISGAAIFGVFLFLTYYLQQTRGFSPIATGLAFLPMSATIMSSAILGQTKLQARFGPRTLVVAGMTLGSLGMLYLTQLGVDSSYAGDVLPSLVVVGVGLGLVISTSISNATLGIEPHDAGVASATINASQQIGASLGTALLSTIATSAVTHYLAGTHHVSGPIAHAAVHGYVVAFSWAAAIFAVGAFISAILFTRRAHPPEPSVDADVRIRYARQEDGAALGRLAELDSAAVPMPPLLVAELGGELRAAVSAVDSAVIADPFHKTVPLVELLRKRAASLTAADTPAQRRRPAIAPWSPALESQREQRR